MSHSNSNENPELISRKKVKKVILEMFPFLKGFFKKNYSIRLYIYIENKKKKKN